jgi:branched-chain amino acid transport system substrate-binding protein
MRTFVGLALVTAALVGTACTGDDDDAPETTVAVTGPPTTGVVDDAPADVTFTFGVLAPGDDLLDELAAGQARGIAVALDDINAAGGVLDGSVATVQADESVDDPIETTVESLIGAGANAILGPVGSASAVEVAAIARDEQLLVCSASATAPSVTTSGTAATFFRTAMRDDDTSGAVADEIMDVDEDTEPPRDIMILGRDDIYGTELVGDLSAQLSARGATVDTILYPARRVEFGEEAETVVAADPDVVVVASFAEGVSLLAELAELGFPLSRVVGLDGLSRADIANQISPDDPSRVDGMRVMRATGDRLLMDRLRDVAVEDEGGDADVQTLYGAQMYDCAITIALAAIAAGSDVAADVGEQVRSVTSGGRTCSTFAHCKSLLEAGEGIAYSGASGGLEIDEAGDISTTRLTTSVVVEGALEDVSTRDIDLIRARRLQFFSSAVVMTQVQQAMKLLGYFHGDVTGVHDEETTAALQAMQRDLGVPETGQYDEATDAALRARLGDASSMLNLATSQLQLELQALGYYDGPIDGRFSAATIAAVRAFQTRIGVPPTGLLDTTTLRQVYVLGQQNPLVPPPPLPEPPPPPTEPPPVTTTPPPPPPVTEPPPDTTVPPPPPPPVTDPPPPATDPPPVTTVPPPPPPETTTTAPPPPDTTTTTAPEPEPDPLPTMYEIIGTDPRFSTFLGLVRRAGFGGDLSAPARPFTVFAPTNAAFDAMDEAERAEWTEDPARLRALLAYHGVDPDAGALTPADFRTGPLRSIHGAALDVVADGSAVTVNGTGLDAPLDASNGVVYPIAAVLVPPA